MLPSASNSKFGPAHSAPNLVPYCWVDPIATTRSLSLRISFLMFLSWLRIASMTASCSPFLVAARAMAFPWQRNFSPAIIMRFAAQLAAAAIHASHGCGQRSGGIMSPVSGALRPPCRGHCDPRVGDIASPGRGHHVPRARCGAECFRALSSRYGVPQGCLPLQALPAHPEIIFRASFMFWELCTRLVPCSSPGF